MKGAFEVDASELRQLTTRAGKEKRNKAEQHLSFPSSASRATDCLLLCCCCKHCQALLTPAFKSLFFFLSGCALCGHHHGTTSVCLQLCNRLEKLCNKLEPCCPRSPPADQLARCSCLAARCGSHSWGCACCGLVQPLRALEAGCQTGRRFNN